MCEPLRVRTFMSARLCITEVRAIFKWNASLVPGADIPSCYLGTPYQVHVSAAKAAVNASE